MSDGRVESLPASGDDRWIMLYCDKGGCRVNTFEHGFWGRCPSCNEPGHRLPDTPRG